ncbi:MAG: hypothetical protein AAB091_06655 [Elusimicrobiota bacterium]
MEISSDYEDLFKILNACKIRYLIAGAYAVIYYTEPRFTKDLDIWIIPGLNQAEKVYAALKKFGAPLRNIQAKDFANKKWIYQIGVAPVRIDIMMDVPGAPFERAWKNRKKVRYGKTPVGILGLRDLIQAKKKSARPQDLLDLEQLL